MKGPALVVLGLLVMLSSLTPTPVRGAEERTWAVRQNDSALKVGYGSGISSPQCAAPYLNSNYFRMNYGPGSGWGASIILLPSFCAWPVSWEQVATPDNVTELAVLSGRAFARTADALFKSDDCGTSWQAVPLGLNTGQLYAMDVDVQTLYLASRHGVVISEDSGESFSWSFVWGWDASEDVDFQDGYGWLAVSLWGSRSGPNRKTPTGGWELRQGDIPWAYMSMNWVAVDSLDPFNVAYIGGITNFRTLDGGNHWVPIQERIIFTTELNGQPVAFSNNEFSEDRGDTWQSLGIDANVLIKDNVSGFFWAARSDGGIDIGRPGQWESYGLRDKNIRSLVVCERQLLAVSTDGEIFRTAIADAPIHRCVFLPSILRTATLSR